MPHSRRFCCLVTALTSLLWAPSLSHAQSNAMEAAGQPPSQSESTADIQETSIENNDQSSEVPVGPERDPAVAIRNFQANPQDGVIRLSWECDPSLPFEGFRLYRSEDPGGPYELLGETEECVYEDNSTEDRQAYHYRIEAIARVEGQSVPAALARTWPPPGPITGLAVSVDKNYIDVRWSQSREPHVANHILFRSRNGGAWEWLHRLGTDRPRYRDSDLEPEDAYRYKVVARDTDDREGEPAISEQIPSPVSFLLRVDRDNMPRRIDLSWRPPENTDGYRLYRRSPGKDWESVGEINGAATSTHSDTGDLADGEAYQYYLASLEGEGEVGLSNSVEGKTKGLPPYPEEFEAQSGLVKMVELSWQPIDDPDVAGYVIHRGTQSSNTERMAKIRGRESDSYTDKGALLRPLEDGGVYYYSILSFNRFGVEGEKHPPIRATTKPRPVGIEGLRVATDNGLVTIAWDKSPEPDVKRYLLYRKQNGGSWSKIGESDNTTTVFTDGDRAPEASYRYRVIAEDRTGLVSDPAESEAIASPLAKEEAP